MNEEKKRGCDYGPFRVVGSIIAGVFIAALFALIIGALVMVLWNWLMPEIFGLGIITYWQGFGIALLVRLLFGAGHKWHGGHHDGRDKYKRAYKARMHHGPRRNWWFDDVYEQWWEAEGAKSFDEFIKREEDKKPQDDK